MGKMSLLGIWRGYRKTLVNAEDGRTSKRDIAVQIATPMLIGALAFAFWPIGKGVVEDIASNVVTGVSIISSLMCGVAVMIFQLRVQLAARKDGMPDRREVELIDETYSDVLWSVVVGFASVILIILSYAFEPVSQILWRATLSAALCFVVNLVMVSCMSLKRLNASYEIVSKVWGRARR